MTATWTTPPSIEGSPPAEAAGAVPAAGRLRSSGGVATQCLWAACWAWTCSASFAAEPPRDDLWAAPELLPLRTPDAAAGQRVVGRFRGAVAIEGSAFKRIDASADGAWFAVRTASGTRLLSTADGAEAAVFPKARQAIAFHPRRRLLATAEEGRVLLREVPSGKVAHTFGEKCDAWSLAFSANGERLAAAGEPGLFSWNLATGAAKSTADPRARNLSPLSVSPDGGAIAAACDDGAAVVWNASTLEVVRTFAPPAAAGPDARRPAWNAVAFTPDGTGLTAGTWDGMIRTWNLADGEQRSQIVGPKDLRQLRYLAPQLLTVGGEVVAFADPARTKFDAVHTVRPHSTVRGTASCVGGRALAVVEDRDDWLRIYDLETTREIRTWPAATVQPYDRRVVQVFPLKGGVAARRHDDAVELRDEASGKPQRAIRPASRKYSATAAAADGAALYFLGADGIESVPAAADAPGRMYAATLERPQALALSQDGRRAAVGGADSQRSGMVGVVDLGTDRILWLESGHRGGISCLAFSPDGRRLASGGTDASVILWDAATGAVLHRIPAHEGFVRQATFSPDGGLLATVGGDLDDVVALWNVEDGASRGFLTSHSGAVAGAVFSPDGRRLVSAGFDGRLHVWDVASGRLLYSLAGVDGPAAQAGAALDGASFFILGEDGVVKWWRFADVAAPPAAPSKLLRTDPPPEPDFERRFDGFLGSVPGRSRFTAVSPDGGLAATVEGGAFDRGGETILIWDFSQLVRRKDAGLHHADSFQGGRSQEQAFPAAPLLRRFVRHAGRVEGLAFSPDGATLYAAFAEAAPFGFRGWDPTTGERRFEAAGLAGEPHYGVRETNVVPSPDGACVALWRQQGLQVHSARDGALRWRRPGQVFSAAFTPDGGALAILFEKRIFILNSATGVEERSWNVEAGGCNSIAAWPSGGLLAAHLWNDGKPSTLGFYEVASGRLARTVAAFGRNGCGCSPTPDGRLWATRVDWPDAPRAALQFLDASSRSVRTLIGPEELPTFVAGGAVMACDAGFPREGFRAYATRDFFDDALGAKLDPLLRGAPIPPRYSGGFGVREPDRRTPWARGLQLARDGDVLAARLPIHGRKSQATAAALAATGLPVKFDFSESTAFSEATLAALGGRSNVLGIRLDDDDPVEEGVAKRLADFHGLEELHIPSEGALRTCIESLASCKRLRVLRIVGSRNGLDDDALDALAEVQSLEVLDVELANSTTGDGLAALGDLTDLRELKLELNEDLPPDALLSLDELVKLEALSLHTNGAFGRGLAVVGDLPSLVRLELGGSDAMDAELKYVAKAKNLKRLRLAWTSATGAGLERLQGVSTLEAFEIEGDDFTGVGLEHLRNNLALRRLDLSNTKLDVAGAASLGKLSSLRWLRLPPHTTDAMLASLGGLVELRELELEKSLVAGPGLKALATMTKLESLRLNGSPVEDDGPAHLTGLDELRTVDLSHSKLTDAGLAHLQGMKRLWELNLSNTAVEKQGLTRLAERKVVRLLVVNGVPLNAEAVEAVQMADPDLHILSD